MSPWGEQGGSYSKRPEDTEGGEKIPSAAGGVEKFRLPLGLLLAALLSAGCRATGAHSPTLDVVGSYFPAWMVCIVLGISLTVIVRQVLIMVKLNDYLVPAPLVYLAMLVLCTLSVWLVYFKN